MPELTIGEWIGFAAMLSLVVVAVMAVGPLCDSFKRDLERGLYSSSLPEIDENELSLDKWEMSKRQAIDLLKEKAKELSERGDFAGLAAINAQIQNIKAFNPQKELKGHPIQVRLKVNSLREEYDPRLYDLAIERGWTLPSVNDTLGAAAWNGYWADKEKAERGELLGRPVAPHRSGGGYPVKHGRLK